MKGVNYEKKRLLSVTALMLTASMVFTGCMSSTVKKNAEQNEPASAPEAVAENNTSEAVSDEEGEAEEAYTDIVLWDDSTDGDANTFISGTGRWLCREIWRECGACCHKG